MTWPNFIGIGAPKAGTTWLAKCLGEHPDVYMPAAKELVAFDYGEFDPNIDDYLAHFAGVNVESAIGEFTTRYLASTRPAERIQKVIPDARLIVCLRNPADQIYSHYWHLARQNFHQATVQPAASFEDALTRYENWLKKPARYWDQLQHWLLYFRPEQFLVLLYDDIKLQPEAVLRQTFEFLGVDPTFTPRSIRDNEGTAVRQGKSPRGRISKLIHDHLYTALSNKVYRPLKQMIGVRRANHIKETLRVRNVMESLFFQKGYPELRAETRLALNREFADQVAGIEQFLGRDLSTWK